MIVVDANVLVYLLIPGAKSAPAQELLRRDSEWAAPILWRSEVRQALTTYVRRGDLRVEAANLLWTKADAVLALRQHLVSTRSVLELAQASGCSAYDCEYVSLAMQLDVPLVTEDMQLRAAFPGITQPL